MPFGEQSGNTSVVGTILGTVSVSDYVECIRKQAFGEFLILGGRSSCGGGSFLLCTLLGFVIGGVIGVRVELLARTISSIEGISVLANPLGMSEIYLGILQ